MSARLCLHFSASPCLWTPLTSPDIRLVKAGANPQNWQVLLIPLQGEAMAFPRVTQWMGFSTHTPLPWVPLVCLLSLIQGGSRSEQAATDSSPQNRCDLQRPGSIFSLFINL